MLKLVLVNINLHSKDMDGTPES